MKVSARLFFVVGIVFGLLFIFVSCSETENGMTPDESDVEHVLEEEEAVPDELPVEQLPDEEDVEPEPEPDVEELPMVEPEPDPDPDIEEPPVEPEPEEVDPLEKEAREKAVAAMLRSWERGRDFFLANLDKPAEELREAFSKIRMEETGIDDDLLQKLLEIHLEEKPEDRGKVFRFEDLIVEYLRLSFLHPEKEQEGLLELFRQVVRDGETEIVAGIVEAMYGIH